MKYRTLQTVFIIFFLTFSLSCNVPLGRMFSSYSSAAQPNKSDIVGVWLPDKRTLEDMRVRGRYKPNISTKLIFHEDGTFEFEDTPNWWSSGTGESLGLLRQIDGEWELVKVGCCWQVDLRVQGLRADFGILEHRFGGSPKYVMEKVLGDPDSGNEMIFVKQ